MRSILIGTARRIKCHEGEYQRCRMENDYEVFESIFLKFSKVDTCNHPQVPRDCHSESEC